MAIGLGGCHDFTGLLKHGPVLPAGISAHTWLDREADGVVLALYDEQTGMAARKTFGRPLVYRGELFVDGLEDAVDSMLRALGCYRPGFDANGAPVQ